MSKKNAAPPVAYMQGPNGQSQAVQQQGKGLDMSKLTGAYTKLFNSPFGQAVGSMIGDDKLAKLGMQRAPQQQVPMPQPQQQAPTQSPGGGNFQQMLARVRK